MNRTSVRLTVLFAALAAVFVLGSTATNAQRPPNAGPNPNPPSRPPPGADLALHAGTGSRHDYMSTTKSLRAHQGFSWPDSRVRRIAMSTYCIANCVP